MISCFLVVSSHSMDVHDYFLVDFNWWYRFNRDSSRDLSKFDSMVFFFIVHKTLPSSFPKYLCFPTTTLKTFYSLSSN